MLLLLAAPAAASPEERAHELYAGGLFRLAQGRHGQALELFRSCRRYERLDNRDTQGCKLALEMLDDPLLPDGTKEGVYLRDSGAAAYRGGDREKAQRHWQGCLAAEPKPSRAKHACMLLLELIPPPPKPEDPVQRAHQARMSGMTREVFGDVQGSVKDFRECLEHAAPESETARACLSRLRRLEAASMRRRAAAP